MRIIERANCYGMLGSCEGLKSLPRRRCRRGYEGLLSKAVGAGMGHHMSIVGSDALDPLSSPAAFKAQIGRELRRVLSTVWWF